MNRSSISKKFKIIFVLLFLFQFTACHSLSSVFSLGRQEIPGQSSNGKFVHHVKYRGETLSKISTWYTGSSKNWVKILKVNPGLRPEKINIGDKILIPKNLLKREAPLRKSYILKAKRKKALSPKSLAKPKTQGVSSETSKKKEVKGVRVRKSNIVSKLPDVEAVEQSTVKKEPELVEEVVEKKDVKVEISSEKQKLLNELLGQ